MIYRVLESLKLWKSGRRIPAGTIGPLQGVPESAIQDLLRLNRIVEVHPPPLEIIPEFKGREGTVIGLLEDPDTSDEEREELMKYIDPAEGPVGGPPPYTDARGCVVPEPITDLDEDGEYISGGLSLEEVEAELRALGPSLELAAAELMDDDDELLE